MAHLENEAEVESTSEERRIKSENKGRLHEFLKRLLPEKCKGGEKGKEKRKATD